MSATSTQIPEQQRKLDLLVQDTLKRGTKLNVQRVGIELGVNHEIARNLMRPYVQKGIGHYVPREQAYFPNLL